MEGKQAIRERLVAIKARKKALEEAMEMLTGVVDMLKATGAKTGTIEHFKQAMPILRYVQPYEHLLRASQGIIKLLERCEGNSTAKASMFELVDEWIETFDLLWGYEREWVRMLTEDLYLPVIKKWASKYAKLGGLWQDLFDEGYVAAFQLAERVGQKEVEKRVQIAKARNVDAFVVGRAKARKHQRDIIRQTIKSSYKDFMGYGWERDKEKQRKHRPVSLEGLGAEEGQKITVEETEEFEQTEGRIAAEQTIDWMKSGLTEPEKQWMQTYLRLQREGKKATDERVAKELGWDRSYASKVRKQIREKFEKPS